MALSPNYQWAEPDNSSLVKNGASDIRTLGNAIDTSLWNVGFGQAGKNKIINGDFRINQRGFTSGTSGFVFDRLNSTSSDGTCTISAETFTPGTAPVTGYEAINFARIVTSGQTLTTAQARWVYRVEDVRTLAGQTATISFWAKAASGTPSIAVQGYQNFGSGGSADVNAILTKFAITTSWVRYSININYGSMSGKTIGTSSHLGFNIWTSAGSTFATASSSLGIQSATIDVWGLQLEAGSVATAFQTATGTIQGEIDACQRYYEKSYTQSAAPGASDSAGSVYLTQTSDGGNNSAYALRFKVEKRNSSWSAAFYTTGGTASNWQYTRSGVGATNATASVDLQSTSGARVYFNVGASWTANTLQGHWVVDNEL